MPFPGDLPNPEIKPTSPGSPALANDFFTTELHGKPIKSMSVNENKMKCKAVFKKKKCKLTHKIERFSSSINKKEIGVIGVSSLRYQSLDSCKFEF